MFKKKWGEMYFDEQQEALRVDKKYNYIHILLKIFDEHTDEYKLLLEDNRYLKECLRIDNNFKKL